MSLQTIEGIIIKSSTYKEYDRMLSIFTPYKGKITCVAKRGTKLQSSRSSSYEQGTYIKATLYTTVEGAMPSVTDISIVEQFKNTKSDMNKMILSQYVMEVIYKNSEDHEENLELFALLSRALTFIEQNKVSLHWKATFDYTLLKRLGFEPNIETCLISGERLSEGIFDIPLGGMTHPKHERKGYRIGRQEMDYLLRLKQVTPYDDDYPVPPKVLKILKHMLDEYAYGPFNTFNYYGLKEFE